MQKKFYNSIGETVYTFTLPNGLWLCVIPKPGFSSKYAVFATNYGGAHRNFRLDGEEYRTPAGIAHYLEHKMFDMPDGDNALNRLSQNGADPNAFTSSGMTAYYFQCTDRFEDNLRLLLRFVSTPYFTDETVEKERGIIGREIDMGLDNPGVVLYYDLLKCLYDHHPIRERVAGTAESISHITAQTLYDCHKVFYSPANMALCVEGDIDPEAVYTIALETLSEEKQPIPHADFGAAEGDIPVCLRKEEAMEVSAPQFLIGAKLVPAEDGEALLRQQLVANLAMRALVGSSSPFYTRLYTEGLLNRDFDYEVDFTAGTAAVIIGGESSQPDSVLTELEKEVERVGKEGIAPELFQCCKRASIGARLRSFEDFENVCIAAVSARFDGFCCFDAPQVLESIEKRECEDFIRTVLAPGHLALAVISPKTAEN